MSLNQRTGRTPHLLKGEGTCLTVPSVCRIWVFCFGLVCFFFLVFRAVGRPAGQGELVPFRRKLSQNLSEFALMLSKGA